MRRQVIIGGAIVVISVASAAAYSIVQARWFGAATPRNVASVETTAAAAPKSGSVAQAPRGVPQASVQGLPAMALTAPTPLAPPPATFAQAPAPQPPSSARPPAALTQ